MITKDAIIIGSGQAAKPLSQKLSRAGWKTVMIERSEKYLGGTCLNTGCTPTKTLIASAQRMRGIQMAGKHGISVEAVHLDYSVTQDRKEEVIKLSKDALIKRTEDAANLELVYGTAIFKNKKTISVKKQNGEVEDYTAEYIFIDAGSRSRIPKIKGLDDVQWYDNEGILELREVPEKLVIVGSGYIGLELGQMFSRLGSKVTILERGETFLPREDADVAQAIFEMLRNEGLDIRLKCDVESIRRNGKEIVMKIKADEGPKELTASHLLLATGRQSNADELQVSSAGIETDDKGFIKVNDKLETNIEKVYALGDINGGPQFTHIAYNDFVIVFENLLEGKDVSKKNRIVPYCMYTDPQLARVGISEKEAINKGLDFEVVKIEGDRITRGIETGKRQGPWKAVVDKKSRQVLGAAIICTEGGEIASVLQMAMEGGLTADFLARAIFSHPSYAESINTLFLELEK